MSNSSLVSYTRWSPNYTKGRSGKKITKITPHYMAGNLTVEGCGAVFAPSSRQASSQYGIGSDGRIGQYVDEANRAWTSSSAANDNQAVTIECANLADSSLTDACWNSLVNLCVDICRRNGIAKLNWTGDTSGNLTVHRMFARTNCPGSWMMANMARLASEVNAKLNGTSSGSTSSGSTSSSSISGTTSKGFGGTYVCTIDELNVRDKPSTSGKIVATYTKNQEVVLDDWYATANGYVWGRYTSYSGAVRYIAVGRATGKVENDDYLVKKLSTQTQSSQGSYNTEVISTGTYVCQIDQLNVRDNPSLSGKVVASYTKGKSVILDNWSKTADGYVWGRYTSYSGAVRYVAVREVNGQVYLKKQ